MGENENTSWWERRGESLGTVIGWFIMAAYRSRFSSVVKTLIGLTLGLIAWVNLVAYRRSERINLQLTRPHGEPNRWFAALGSRIVDQFVSPAPPVSLDATLYTTITEPSQALHLQLALERDLVVLARSENTHTMRWTKPRQRFAMVARMVSIITIPLALLTIGATQLMSESWITTALRTFAIVVVSASVVTLIGAGVVLLVLRHDRLKRMKNERYPQAVALAGGVGALPAWSLLVVDSPVLLHLLLEDPEIEQTFGEVIDFDLWLSDRAFTSYEAETMQRLAGEYHGTLDELAATAKALR